jgi:hypothetical protein
VFINKLTYHSGELKIAEVVSRFSDLDSFITLLEGLGFDFMDKVNNRK